MGRWGRKGALGQGWQMACQNFFREFEKLFLSINIIYYILIFNQKYQHYNVGNFLLSLTFFRISNCKHKFIRLRNKFKKLSMIGKQVKNTVNTIVWKEIPLRLFNFENSLSSIRYFHKRYLVDITFGRGGICFLYTFLTILFLI